MALIMRPNLPGDLDYLYIDPTAQSTFSNMPPMLIPRSTPAWPGECGEHQGETGQEGRCDQSRDAITRLIRPSG